MSGIKGKWVGGQQLDRKFKRLASGSIRRKVVRKAARAGGGVIVKAVRRNSPVDTKLLKRSFTQKIKWYRTSGTIVSVIGAKSKKERGRNPANYLHLLEGGVKPHTIPGPVTFERGGVQVTVPSVDHPGFPAMKFMERSFRQTHGQALRKFRDKYKVEILAEARK